jgi:aminoglycoside phosphotransferase (APT) family kinase protein
MSLEDCLPAALRGPDTTIARVSAGLSGASVYRVDAGGQTYVLKVSAADEPLDHWRRALEIRRLAADAGVAPRVVHADEARRAVLSAFVADRSFPAFYRNPATHEATLARLGRTLRRVHDLPIPAGAEARGAREFVAATWAGLGLADVAAPHFAVPRFAAEMIEAALAEEPPPSERPLVLSHNDVNPSNLFHDGERIVLLDWEVAAPNDPFYDLAVVSLFLRMDAPTCERLVAAHDGAAPAPLPARFGYVRRLAGALLAATFMHLARQRGHPGATGAETLEATPSLADFYQRMLTGAASVATAEGQWAFGLALLKESVAV